MSRLIVALFLAAAFLLLVTFPARAGWYDVSTKAGCRILVPASATSGEPGT